jgi:hypothetical protein
VNLFKKSTVQRLRDGQTRWWANGAEGEQVSRRADRWARWWSDGAVDRRARGRDQGRQDGEHVMSLRCSGRAGCCAGVEEERGGVMRIGER